MMYALSIDTISSYENRETVWGGKYVPGAQRRPTAQGKDFQLILTLKMETRHQVGGRGPFSREFSAFVIIVELWRPKSQDLKIL